MLETAVRAAPDHVVQNRRPGLIVEPVQEPPALPHARTRFHLAQHRLVGRRGLDMQRGIQIHEVAQSAPAPIAHLESHVLKSLGHSLDGPANPVGREHQGNPPPDDELFGWIHERRDDRLDHVGARLSQALDRVPRDIVTSEK